MVKHLYLIDATAFCYRAFYALPGLATSFGQPTNAIYGFINMLNKILKEKKPEYLAICFDVSRDTFRQKKFAEYKIQRPPMPDKLSNQIPLIKEIITAYGIAIFEKEGFEADDIIATMARKAKKSGLATIIVSSDKDILQLVDDGNTLVFSPYEDKGIIYDEKKVSERFEVSPKQIPDVLALSGDTVDNIPGIPGIANKTAVKLINNFGSTEELLDKRNSIKEEKIRKAISENIKKIKLNKELTRLDDGVDIEFDPGQLKVGEPNFKELFRLFKYLEFKKFLKDLPQEEPKAETASATKKDDAGLKSFIRQEDELLLCGDALKNMEFYAKGVLFQVRDPGSNIKDILEDPKVKKISHDLKKIKICLARDNISLGGLFFDTMISAYLLNPSQSSYNLADLAWEHLGMAISPNVVSTQKAVNLILQLRPVLEKKMHEKSLFGLFSELEMPLAGVLAEMELTGIKLDLKVLEGLSRDLEKRLITLIEDIYRVSGAQFNINSPKQLREVLFEKLKLRVVRRSKTGPSTDEEVLRTLAQEHELPALLLEYRQLTKLKNTYIDILPELVEKNTGKLHTSFNQTATETGRLSSSNPNLQNIPIKTDIGKNIRRAIIASNKQSCLVSCDYSQIELRILAHLSKDKNLILAFKQNKDVHKATASLIYGIEETEVTDEMREVAKRVNFGIIYGLSSFGLSRDLGISLDEAEQFIDAYFLRYPKVKEYIQAQILKAQKDGFVTTLLGRRRYIPEINNKNQGIRQFAERQAVNTPIQGSASDLIKLAMIQINQRIKEENLESRMVLQIHDELVFDVPDKELKKIADLVRDRMENALSLDVPIRVDIKQGKNWLEMEERREEK